MSKLMNERSLKRADVQKALVVLRMSHKTLVTSPP